MPKIVYKYKDEYKLNNYAISYLHYKYDSFTQALNYKDYNKVLSVGGRKMLTTEEYINQLQQFTDNEILFSKADYLIQQAKKENSISKFAEVADKWLNKPLSKEDKATLCDEIAACRSQGKKASWQTTKDLLLQAGYSITEKTLTINSKRQRVSIIQT